MTNDRINREVSVTTKRTTRVEIEDEEVFRILREAVNAPKDATVEIGEYVKDAVVTWTETVTE